MDNRHQQQRGQTHMYNLTKIKRFRVSIIKPEQNVFKTHIFKKRKTSK